MWLALSRAAEERDSVREKAEVMIKLCGTSD